MARTATIERDAATADARISPPAHFSVLGPLEIASGRAGVLTPRAQKIRIVLAALLVNNNSVVSAGTLIREVWDDFPPRTALAALRVYVSQVRRVLGPLGGGLRRPKVVTQPPGYRLEIDPDCLDTIEFDRHCVQGRRSGAEHRFDVAASHYHHALALWRGPALSDVRGGPLLEGAALRLEESRLVALARRVDLDLRLGRHLEVLPELRALTTEHPFNETLQARLMIALCRSGRTNEALDVFGQVRGSLAEQLNVAPNRELQRVHQAVLASDDRKFEQADLWAG